MNNGLQDPDWSSARETNLENVLAIQTCKLICQVHFTGTNQ